VLPPAILIFGPGGAPPDPAPGGAGWVWGGGGGGNGEWRWMESGERREGRYCMEALQAYAIVIKIQCI
jgi:hypothetical protein